MRTELFHIGGFTVYGYGFMIAIGFILALFVAELRAKLMKMKDEPVIDIAIIAGITGFAGAKLLYVLVSFKDFLVDPLAVLGSSGFVVYGGIIVGTLCCGLYCKFKKLSFLEYFDLVMPEIAIAQGFGRIGCFLAGCCYGRETDSFIGVMFPEGSLAPAGVSLIPTQLISAIADFCHAGILIFIAWKFSYAMAAKRKSEGVADDKNKHLSPGHIGCIYVILYGIGRFLIEFLRNDYRGEIGILSTSQFISLVIVVFGVALMIATHKMFANKPIRELDIDVSND